MTANNTIYELSDVDVDTLGLVTHGANQEEFFMLKSADADTTTSAIPETLWRRIAAVIKNAFTLEATEPVTELVTEPEIAKTEPVTEATESAIVPIVEKVESSTEQLTAEPVEPAANLQKESITMSDESNAEPTEFVSKSEHEIVVQEVAVLKAALAQAQEDKERAVYLTKAQSYTALPVPQSELADYMYWLAKTDPTRYAWFESVIKAVDNTLHDANLFAEQGTNAPIENNAITAALKSADPRAALLSLDRNQANAYLQAMRKAQ